MINSKRKGSNFERDIVKHFTEWSKIVFKRNWGVEKQYMGILRGDIVPEYTCPLDVEAHPLVLVIECKHRESWELEDLLLHPNVSSISKWYEQTKKEAMGTMAYPFLIIKKSYHLPLCVYPYSLYNEYTTVMDIKTALRQDYAPKGSLLFTSTDWIIACNYYTKYVITPLCTFFSTYEYKKIEELVKKKIIQTKGDNISVLEGGSNGYSTRNQDRR